MTPERKRPQGPRQIRPYKRVSVIEQAMQQIARGEKPRDPMLGLDITEDEAEMVEVIQP
jgi:hypothetical protein